MAQMEISACEQATLLAQYVIQELCSDRMDAGAYPQILLSLLKSNDYHHAPLYVCKWGPINGSPPVWCVQVHHYEKQLSYDFYEICHIYYATPSPLSFT
jgi:hypothetical protein